MGWSSILAVTVFLQMFLTAGIVLNEGINFLLKHLIKEPRPINSMSNLHHYYITHYQVICRYLPSSSVCGVRHAIQSCSVHGLFYYLLQSVCLCQVSVCGCVGVMVHGVGVTNGLLHPPSLTE